MLKFLLSYPIKHYAKSLFSPKAKGPKLGFYFGGDKAYLLIKGKTEGGMAHWEPNLKSYLGAPSLAGICRSEIDQNNPNVPSSFRKEIGIPNRIQTGNETQIVFEDTQLHIELRSIENHSTIGSVKRSLEEDPSELIQLWSTFNNTEGDYQWEVLDTTFRSMNEKEKTPSRVFLIGYPEEKIQGMCMWGELFNAQINNFIPASIAVSRMVLDYETRKSKVENSNSNPGTFYILYNGQNESNLVFFTRGQCLLYQSTRTSERINANVILKAIEEIRDQEDLPFTVPVHLWGFQPTDYLIEGLDTEGWSNVKNWEPESLMGEIPLLLEKSPEEASKITQPEPWLLEYLMR